MRPPKANIADHFSNFSLDKGISALETDFKNWEIDDGRGRKSLWNLLGKVYELGSEIAGNDLTRAELIAIVSKDSNVEGNNRWQAEKKHPFDLLLVMLIGLKEETKATKSQWLRTLKVAGAEKVTPKQDEFVTWITRIGGIEATLRLGRKPSPKKLTLNKLAKEIRQHDNPAIGSIKLPEPLSEQSPPEGLSLVITRTNSKGEIRPLGTIVNDRQIADAIRTFLADVKRIEKKNERQLRDEVTKAIKAERKLVRAKFNADKKVGKIGRRHKPTFAEYYEEYRMENANSRSEWLIGLDDHPLYYKS